MHMNAEARAALEPLELEFQVVVICPACVLGTELRNSDEYLSSFHDIYLTKIKLTDNVSFTSLPVLAHFLLQNGFSSVQATQLQTTQSVEGKCFPGFFVLVSVVFLNANVDLFYFGFFLVRQGPTV